MKLRRSWRILVVFLMALLVLPSGRSFAAGSESGATVVAIGERTVTINGKDVPSSRQRESVVVAGKGFSAGELVGLWLTLPDYAVVGLDDDKLKADSNGEFAIELLLSPTLPVGWHYFSARGQQSGKGGIASFYLQPGRGPTPTEGSQLSLSPATAAQQEIVTVSFSGFAAGERVALWATLPNGAVASLGSATADKNGAWSAPIYLGAGLPVGRHYFTAFGTSSGSTAITPFVLKYGNGLNVPGAQIAVNAGRTQQRSFVEVQATGFTAKETVSFWLTQPDGSVLNLGTLRAASDGSLNGVIYINEKFPAGTHYLSVRGDTSGLSFFAKLTLDPGPNKPGAE